MHEAGGFPWGSPGPGFQQEQWEDLSEQPVCVQGVLSLTASLYLLFSVWCHLSRLMERDGRFADEHAERRAGGLLDFMVPNEDTGQEEVQSREMGTEDPPPIGRQPGARPALRFLKCQSPVSAQRASHRKTGGRQVALCGITNNSMGSCWSRFLHGQAQRYPWWRPVPPSSLPQASARLGLGFLLHGGRWDQLECPVPSPDSGASSGTSHFWPTPSREGGVGVASGGDRLDTIAVPFCMSPWSLGANRWSFRLGLLSRG
uniref:Uncharacterized protein n=1 Tax=Spermophilus dauricus TaxID=99837 RepID=A0A8C9QLU6_SPEDA